MKDDFSQDEKISINSNQTGNSSSADDDSLDWAKQAYLQLKQKQKEEKELCQKEIEEKEILKTKTNTNEDFQSNITVENSLQVSQETEVEDQPQLGDFDDTFTCCVGGRGPLCIECVLCCQSDPSGFASYA